MDVPCKKFSVILTADAILTTLILLREAEHRKSKKPPKQAAFCFQR